MPITENTNPLDEIQADAEIKMTEDYKRAFIFAGCDPGCHCCGKGIAVGDVFKLAYIISYRSSRNPHFMGGEEGKDEMLCGACTPAMLVNKRKEICIKHEKDLKDPNYLHSIRNVGYTRKHTK